MNKNSQFREGGGGEWGGWPSISLLFENSILLIKVQGYRGLTEKWKTVKKSAHFKVQCYKDK